MPLDESHRFVVWCNGDFAQLDVTTDPETVAECIKKFIDACKQSAARTGSEQACDLSPFFKILMPYKQSGQQCMFSLEKANPKIQLSICLLHDAQVESGLCLHNNKEERALIDYLVCLPQILSSIVTPSNVQVGFYENGTVANAEPSKYACPCFNGMLATCCKFSLQRLCLCVKRLFLQHWNKPSNLEKFVNPSMMNGAFLWTKMLMALKSPRTSRTSSCVTKGQFVSLMMICYNAKMPFKTRQLLCKMPLWPRKCRDIMTSGPSILRLLPNCMRNSQTLISLSLHLRTLPQKR
jgi:hypothetical protein